MSGEQAEAIVKRAYQEELRRHGWDQAKAYEAMLLREGREPQFRMALLLVGLNHEFATRH